jgi:hypothetical protein
MTTTKTCPACQKENPLTASICSFCNIPLIGLLPPGTTEPVPDQPVKIRHPDHVVQLTKLYANILVFTVLGQEHPILVKGEYKTILGRYSPGEIAPAVDLTPYNANLLGVSRQHALITPSNKTYLLQDMDSTNGTWLNEIKLTPHRPYPIRSGDLIRLGQLALYIYFDTSQTDQDDVVELILKKPMVEGIRNQLTPQEFSQHIAPYLSVIEQIQNACDEFAARELSIVSIHSLVFDSDSAQIKIKLNGIRDAIRILKHEGLTGKITEPIPVQSITSSSTANQTEPTQQNPHLNGEENRTDNGQFILELLNEIAPLKSETDKKNLVAKLLTLINTLKTNPLLIVDGL